MAHTLKHITIAPRRGLNSGPFDHASPTLPTRLHCFGVTQILWRYQQQQYHVVQVCMCWVRTGLGFWLMGKLGRAWVGAWVVHG